MELKALLDQVNDGVIYDSLLLTDVKFRKYDKILCSISGGSDSDILLDLCCKVDYENKVTYAFFDTGLEFEATKEHIEYLKKKYGVDILCVKAIKSIPTCCKQYGQPFLSKQVSEWIARLQRHNFKWVDKPMDELLEAYPKCKAAIRWWCNDYPKSENGRESRFNIAYNQYLKEFMIKYPPTFKISNKCCTYAKKKVAEKFKLEGDFDLNMYGVRKAEGGARTSAYKNCFSEKTEGVDEYRPIFWYKNDNKREYEDAFGIVHSKCYLEYGLKRTGCAGCPFGRDFEQELCTMKLHEPKLYKAVNNIFGDAYAYTRAYKEFAKGQKKLSDNLMKEE